MLELIIAVFPGVLAFFIYGLSQRKSTPPPHTQKNRHLYSTLYHNCQSLYLYRSETHRYAGLQSI